MKLFFDNMLKEEIRNKGMNPDNPSFLNDNRYSEIKNNKVYYNNLSVTVDYYIRREWFSDLNENGKQAHFDSQSRWNGKSFDASDLIKEIEDEIRNELQGTQYDDENKYDSANIKNKLFGTSGLRNNLKQRFGFDTTSFRKTQKYEEFKLLKILYRIEKHHDEKINITKLLSDLSLEINDRSIFGEQSVHGQIVNELLTEIHLAIDEQFPTIANQSVIDLVGSWNDKLLQIHKLAYSEYPKEIRLAELERIKDYGTRFLQRIDSPQPVSENKILESFYLRVLQLKQTARTHDLDRVTNFIIKSKQTEDLRKQKRQKMPLPLVFIEDAVQFVQENLDNLVSYIYPEDKDYTKKKQFLLKQAEGIPALLSIYNKQKVGNQQKLNTTFLVSCLQEIKLTHTLKEGDEEYAFKNEYYLANGKPQTLTSVYKKMTKLMDVQEVFQLVWTTKLERRINFNLGRLEEYLLLMDIGTICNGMINAMMSIPDLQSMQIWNNHLLSQMIVADNTPILLIAGEFDHIMNRTTGLSCDLRTMRLFYYFENDNVANFFMPIIVEEVKFTMNQLQTEDLQLMILNIYEQNFYLGFSIDLKQKEFILHFFVPEQSDEDSELMISSGLSQFVKGSELFEIG